MAFPDPHQTASTARLVQRPQVQRQIRRGLDRPLTLIAAPAGFGKTTALGAWIQQEHLSVAWVSLDAGDDDPAQFWTYVFAALNMRHAGVADTALAMLAAPQPPPMATVLRALLNEIAALDEEIVLVLDDYHAITTPAIHEALALMMRSHIGVLQGRLHAAEDHLHQLIQLVESRAGAPRALAGGAYDDFARLLYERNYLAAAWAVVKKLLAVGQQWDSPDDLLSANIRLAYLYQAQGQPDAALEAMQQAEQLYQQMVRSDTIFPWIPTYVAASIARLALRQGRLAVAERWAQKLGFQDDPAASRWPTYHQDFAGAVYVRLLLAQERPDVAGRLLDYLLATAEAEGRQGSVVELTLLRALVCHAQGENEPALASLRRSLTLAVPEGYVPLFVDEGEPLRALLVRLRERLPKGGSLRNYCDLLLSAFTETCRESPCASARG